MDQLELTQSALKLAVEALRFIAEAGGRRMQYEDGSIQPVTGEVCSEVASSYLAQIEKNSVAAIVPDMVNH